jgi:hypothetical protein
MITRGAEAKGNTETHGRWKWTFKTINGRATKAIWRTIKTIITSGKQRGKK